MPYAFVAAAAGVNDAAGTTLDCSTALNVEAGDLLVAWTVGAGGDFDAVVASSTGIPAENNFTFDVDDKLVFVDDLVCAFGYVLNAAGDPAATFRYTTPSRSFRHIIIQQFRPSPGYVSIKDGSATGSGISTAPQSGTINTSGTDGVACGGYGEYHPQTTTSELINAASATEPAGSPASDSSAWYRILTAPFVGGRASATLPGSFGWVCCIIAFKSGYSPESNPETITFLGDLIELRPETIPA